jgi:hypothetical protein
MNVLSLGGEWLKQLLVTRFEPGPNINNNEQHNNVALAPLIWQGIIDYGNEQGRIHGESYASIIVRALTKYELRDEEKDTVGLPSNFTKRSMYEQYCYESGWAIKADNKGRYPPVAEYAKRNTTDILWQETM